MNALEKDPARRPVHAGELGRTALALRTALTAGSDATAVLPVATALPRPVRRTTPVLVRNHQRWVRLASVLLAVVVIALSIRACGGANSVVIPAVPTGATVDAATADLAAAKLDAVRATETSKTVSAGRVIRIDPPAGTKAHEGDEVTLVVSSGKPKVSVVSASYVGKSPDSVRASLLGLGLAPTFAYDGAGAAAGTVSGVTPAGSLSYGSGVTIHVVPPSFTPRRKHDKHGDKGD
jgi:serine/threonine-protein kinase